MKKISLLIVICISLFSCNRIQKGNVKNQSTLKNEKLIETSELIIGSWKDTTSSQLHFTLFEDGSAQSDNMTTLLYRKWKLDGNKITFTIESIGNGNSFIDEETFTIDELTTKKMVLKKGNVVSMIMHK